MKKNGVLLALAGCAITGQAFAQSSVTLYGVIDTGIGYIHNSQTSAGNQSTQVKFGGALMGSRWGVRGSEDLGSGMSAIFQLENGYNPGTGALGQGGRMFGRSAIVGLSSRFGTVKLGRTYDPVTDLVQPLTEDNFFSGLFVTPGDVDNYDNDLRVSNAVKYISPMMSGVQVEALYAFGGVAGSTGSGQTYSAAVSYTNGPLGAAAGYFHADGGNTLTNGIRTWTSSSDSLFFSAINQGFASAKSIDIIHAGIQYAIGKFTLGAGYSHSQYNRDANSRFTDAARFDNGAVYVNYAPRPDILLGVGYNFTRLNGPANASYYQANLGAQYLLSKRTSLYWTGGYQKANGTNLSASGALVPAQASVGSYGVNSGTGSQLVTVVGIRHKF
ncbi:porin [Paraburkholderia sartisoli]|uniref:Outer membrane protein (Porin) n=1 Tax=Paraburkholderia sartisoli TaxID=83784 RepID=A0A1H4D2D7_9BURK|nr:porin [Paraburkholderia sartisoli]SEA66748.1 Outer membrane protein (porin) [Paraburkholderia sartisoli]